MRGVSGRGFWPGPEGVEDDSCGYGVWDGRKSFGCRVVARKEVRRQGGSLLEGRPGC